MYVRMKNNSKTYPFIGISYNPIFQRYIATLYTSDGRSDTFGRDFSSEKEAIAYAKSEFENRFGFKPIASHSLKYEKVRVYA